MNRRTLIAALGSSLALGGCLSTGSTPTGTETPGSKPTDDERSSADNGATGTPSTEQTPTPSSSDDSFAVGETTGEINPLGVTFVNDGDTARTVRLTITDTAAGEERLSRTVTVAGGGSLTGDIRAPSDYEIRAELPEQGTETVEEVDRGLFDTCNGYNTTVTIESDGDLTASTMTTLVLCDEELTITTNSTGT